MVGFPYFIIKLVAQPSASSGQTRQYLASRLLLTKSGYQEFGKHSSMTVLSVSLVGSFKSIE